MNPGNQPEDDRLWRLLGHLTAERHSPPLAAPSNGFTQAVMAQARALLIERRAPVVRLVFTLAAAACILVVVSLGLDLDKSQSSISEGPNILDADLLAEVYAEVPVEDREVIALLHLADDLGTLDAIEVEEIDAAPFALTEDDELALALAAEFNAMLEEGR